MSTSAESSALSGQSDDYAALLVRARRLALPHGLLLEGPAGGGKSHAALEFATALLCEDEESVARACGVCRACAKVLSGNHPDLHVVTPPPDKSTIPVDTVREIRATLELRPVEGRARVVLLDPGDGLNEAGQNALLKTLEEPGDGTFLLLTARRPEGLLPTVRSRVARYRLRPLDEATARSRCVALGLDPGRVARAVELSAGSVGMAKALAEMDLEHLEGLFDEVADGRVPPAVAAARALDGAAEGRVGADARARLVFRVAGARCRLGLGAETLPSSLAHDRSSAYGSAPGSWLEAAEAVLAAEQDLGLEISAHHALTEMFLRWSRAFRGG